MTFEDLVERTGSWLDGTGSRSALVVSSRVRLARNLRGVRFPHRATEEERQGVIDSVLAACSKRRSQAELTFFDANSLDALQRQLLLERHLISPALAKGTGPRGVLVSEDEVVRVLLNEEDHLRIQVILSGLRPQEAWCEARRLEQDLSADLAFGFAEEWGHLTACPTNAGTGLRASILVHLPGLVLTQEMERVARGIAEMGSTVRGLYGEGTEAAGNLFQVSNQVTLGRSEGEILEALDRVNEQLIECEETAQDRLMRDARAQIEDKIWRAYGILNHARLLTSQEFMNLSSAVRLGVGLGIIRDIGVGDINELMVRTRSSHVQCFAGRRLEPCERDRVRAEMVRRRMAEARGA
jgi:protein arginine kinase